MTKVLIPFQSINSNEVAEEKTIESSEQVLTKSFQQELEEKMVYIEERGQLHEQIFRVLLPHYMGLVNEFEKRFGTMDKTAHVCATDPLILAIADPKRYETLNMYAAEWLVGDQVEKPKK